MAYAIDAPSPQPLSHGGERGFAPGISHSVPSPLVGEGQGEGVPMQHEGIAP